MAVFQRNFGHQSGTDFPATGRLTETNIQSGIHNITGIMTTKFELLTQLKMHTREWISGEYLSRRLGVSRMAVSKHIGKLKSEGYEIISAPKKGYRLNRAPDILTSDELRSELNTKIFGQSEIIYLPQTRSTNLIAREYASNGSPEGFLIIADSQTEGRGRQHRYWHSPSGGGIYLSMILRPSLPPNETPVITLMTAVALLEAIRMQSEIPLRIKWPNDILSGDKKLAGILTEINTYPDSVNFVIVGVGINVNTSPEKFPDEIKDIATSISAETGKYLQRKELLASFLSIFETWYALFEKREFQAIINRWKSYSDIIGRVVSVDILGTVYSGKVVEIDVDGTLIIEDGKGKRKRLLSGDIIESTQ